MSARFKINDTMRVRQVALEIVIKAVQAVRGWEIKTAAELIGEAEHVERWIKTGDAKEKKAGKKRR